MTRDGDEHYRKVLDDILIFLRTHFEDEYTDISVRDISLMGFQQRIGSKVIYPDLKPSEEELKLKKKIANKKYQLKKKRKSLLKLNK